MRVFVTGASGWIGAPTLGRLLAAGHAVHGLARSEETASTLRRAGAIPVRGDLGDLNLLAEAASASDGVVHLAFRHDIAFTGDFAGAAASDRLAIERLGDALAGSEKPLLIASGTMGVAPGRVATERDLPVGDANPRQANAALALALAGRGVRSVVVRFPPTVHGAGDGGFVATLVDIARTSGVSGYLGNGANRWPAVHVTDAADLLVAALEHAPAGSVLHASAEEGVATRDIAAAIGDRLDLPVRAIEDPSHFGFLAGFFGMDAPASSELTRSLLDWQPTGPQLLEDLNAGVYTDQGPARS